jgi:fructokinase
MSRPVVVAVGEILWDLLPGGRQLGGAPGNFVHHARSLGAEASLISRVGRDSLGDEAAARMEGLQRDESALTGTAAVTVDADGQPRFVLAADVAWDRIEADPRALRTAARADAFCFGTLAQRSPGSRGAIRTLLGACRPDALRILDLNLRDPFWTEDVVLDSFQAANLVKLNGDELDRCSAMLKLTGDPRARIAALSEKFRLKLLAVTRGGGGSVLYSGGVWSDHPGLKVQVRDAVGAGDAFTAALVLGVLRGDPLERINRHANEVGAFVCTQPGATPQLPPELTHRKENP